MPTLDHSRPQTVTPFVSRGSSFSDRVVFDTRTLGGAFQVRQDEAGLFYVTVSGRVSERICRRVCGIILCFPMITKPFCRP